MADYFDTPPDINNYIGTSTLQGVHPAQEFAMADKSGEERDTRADSMIAMINYPGAPYNYLKPDYDAFMLASPGATVQQLLDWFNDRLEIS